MQNLRYKFEYFLFIALKNILKISPKLKNKILNILTFLLFFIVKKYKKIVRKNLEIAFGTDFANKNYKDFTKKCIKNLLENAVTIIENSDRNSEDIANLVEFDNREIVDDLLKNGKSIIFSSGHLSNWELLVTAIASQITSGVGVAEKLKNPYLDKILVQSREKFRIKVIPMKGALRNLIKAIKQNSSVFVIIDQAVNVGFGAEKDFFNFPAIHTETNRFLSEKYNLFIVPTYIRFENGKYRVHFEQPFKSSDVEDSLEKEINILETEIMKNPENWLWCHRRWKNHKDLYK